MKQIWAMGMMSGTSMDGVDAALVKTDGKTVSELGAFNSFAYTDTERQAIAAVLGGHGDIQSAENVVTQSHIRAALALIEKTELPPNTITLIGFHGQTILHEPENGRTWQLGDGQTLADATGIPVVNRFRDPDMAAGGEGAPLAPLYHAARLGEAARPAAILNLGGVGNVTWIGHDDHIIGFDTGPANALLDDWIYQNTGQRLDADGRISGAGQVDAALLEALLAAPYFTQPPPKSLDRQDFAAHADRAIRARYTNAPPLHDVARTLVAFTAESAALAGPYFPQPPQAYWVTGGGRHNPTLMAALAKILAPVPVQPVEAMGWRGDALEAEAFAFLAVRSLYGLPLSAPSVTGARHESSGGQHCHPSRLIGGAKTEAG